MTRIQLQNNDKGHWDYLHIYIYTYIYIHTYTYWTYISSCQHVIHLSDCWSFSFEEWHRLFWFFHITQQCHRKLPLIFLPPRKVIVIDIDPFNFHSTHLQSIVLPIFTSLSKITNNLLFDHPAMPQTITLWFSHHQSLFRQSKLPLTFTSALWIRLFSFKIFYQK